MTAGISRLARRVLPHSPSLAYAPRMDHRPADSALMLRYRDGDVAAFETLPTAKFTTFLYHVAHNCYIDHVRRNKRHGNTADVEPDS